MKPQPRIVVIGTALEAADGWERIACAEAGLLVPSAVAPVLALVGDDAIETVDPLALRPAMELGLTLLLVPRGCAYERFAAWVRLHPCEIARPETVAGRAAALVRRGLGVRLLMPSATWSRRQVEPGSAAASILDAIGQLTNIRSVPELTRALGWPRHRLLDVCRDDLGASPREVLFWHAEAQVNAARERGFTLEEIARALDFPGADGLAHAFSRRGRRPSRRPR